MTDCIKQIVKAHGLKGLFRGTTTLVLRDSLSFGTYFWIYEKMRRTNKELHIIENQMTVNLISGEFAGNYY